MSILASFKYHDNGVLPDGTKLPDMPVLTLLIIRRDIGKAAIVEGLVDTGFDGGIYSNLELANFLSNLKPTSEGEMEVPGHLIKGEVFELPVALIAEKPRRRVDLGMSEIFVSLSALDLTEDMIIGRKIINKLKILLDGPNAKLTVRRK